MALVKAAREQAARNIRNPDLWEVAREFFREEFHLPSTHEAFQNWPLEDLLVEMFETRFRKNPMSAFRNEDGTVQFTTGDPLIDKWEAEHAKGLTPDLTEGLTKRQRAAMDAVLGQQKAEQAAVERFEAARGKSAGFGGVAASPTTWRQVHDALKAGRDG